MKKYSKYMDDVDKFICPYHHEEKPMEVFESILKHVGFKISHLEMRDQVFIYDSVELLRCRDLFIN
jgi:juvenile hormone acid methyltransferase